MGSTGQPPCALPDPAMNSQEARTQIEHMKQFILHEAEEQRKEIENKAKEECQLELQRIVGRERQKLNDQYDKLKDLVKVQAKVEDSKISNTQKLRVLEAKNSLVQAAFQAASEALRSKAGDQAMIQGLIRQGVLSFASGTQIKVKCRKQDQAAVSAACSAVGGSVSMDS